MSGSGGSLNKISETKVSAMMNVADSITTDAGWKPAAAEAAPGTLYRARLVAKGASAEKVSLEETLRNVRKKDKFLNPVEHAALFNVRRAMQIGLAVAEEYKVLVGLEGISNKTTLSSDKKNELQEKSRTAAAITLFTWASYVQRSLAQSGNEASFAEHVTLPEFVLDEPISGLRCVLYYLSLNLRHPTVQTDLAVTTTIFFYAERVLEEIEKRKESFKHLQSFEEIAFGIEGEDFTIDGLNRHDIGASDVEFNRVELSSIVGNSDAKHFARRQAERMMSYNFKEKKNVFVELGGFMWVWAGSGKPGTGKSMLIAAMATLLKDYSSNLGVPFRFHPLPDNIVDSYQGKTAQNMLAWMKPLSSPDAIIFAPIDDAENLFENRSRENVSEGARAAQGVFLRNTEGAYSVVRGNSSIGFFTNLLEQIDPASLSRVQGRMIINGAESREDWLDQGQLWWSKRYGGQDGFVNLSNPENYKYQSAQGQLKSMAEASQTHNSPTHDVMKDIFERVLKKHDPDGHDFFAQLFIGVVEKFPTFSSRDYRNIQSAVDSRVMDFDMPSEWFEKPEAFTGLDYERQKAMVLELRSANMKGLSFKEIYLQEAVKYLDHYATIANMDFERQVEAYLKQLRITEEGQRRFQKK